MVGFEPASINGFVGVAVGAAPIVDAVVRQCVGPSLGQPARPRRRVADVGGAHVAEMRSLWVAHHVFETPKQLLDGLEEWFGLAAGGP